MAFNAHIKQGVLSDSNPHIINFYRSIQSGKLNPGTVRHYLEREGDRLRNAANDGYDHYRLIRSRFNTSHDPLDFLFLSRAGFNGMMRFNKSGGWNIPFCKKPDRFRQSYITKIVNQVKAASELLQRDWALFNLDFREVIQMAEADDLIYCDPPYYGRYVDYYNGWTQDDEADLFRELKKSKAKFILSTWHHNKFRKNEMIDQYWNEFNIATKDHFYHSGAKIENRNTVVEALVYNFDADIPAHAPREQQRPMEEPSLFQSLS